MGRLEGHVSRRVCCEEAFGSGERGQTETFWRFSTVWPSTHQRKDGTRKQPPPQMSNQMLDSLEGYLDNIAAAATQTAATGTPLAELAASLAVSVDTVARQQIEIKRLTEHINALQKKGAAGTPSVPVQGIIMPPLVPDASDRKSVGDYSPSP